MSPVLLREFYSRHPRLVARGILGKTLVRRVDGQFVIGIITDTEAYGPPPEDHAVRREGARGLRLSWEPGLLWTTYLIRGRPTLNITTQTPSCVLIRAVEPILGWKASFNPVGPINLARALSIDLMLDKTDVTREGRVFVCYGPDPVTGDEICESKRKNLKTDTQELRRFYLRRSRFVS